ncbi:hypothetical protein [Streptomyces mangrovi]|uniref:hypothetical protein n=1 Tax=Streptomyces mangrovi TaxID=1206892 RepID=UPI00399D3985
MSKQRFVAAGVAAVALAGLGGTAFALQGQGQGLGGDRGAARPAAAPERPAGTEATGPRASSVVRVVRPYEPVGIGRGALMGLLPEGRQNHVVSWGGPEAFREDVEHAKGIVGDSIRPGGLSFGHSSTPEGAVLYTGAFRTETEPARITVTAGGRTWEAGMVRLPGDPGWGAYHVDAGRTGLGTRVTVTAYGPDGAVPARGDTRGEARDDTRDDGADLAR